MKKIILVVLTAIVFVSCGQSGEPVTVAPQVKKSDVIVENIMSRRSIRAYKPEQVAKSKIDRIMQCGINAPSANNKQSWEVRVIQNAELLVKIKGIKNVFYDAPTLIVVAGDKNNPSSAVDCGLLTQNILLSAEALDLGTCVLGSLVGVLKDPNAKGIVDALALPEGYEVLYGISLGYKNETPDAKPREVSKVKYID